MPATVDRYPSDPSDRAARMEERIRDLERQVRDLQASQGIRSTAMAGGAMRVIDAATGDEVARLGVGGFGGPGGAKPNRRILAVVSGGVYRFLVTAEDGHVWPPVRAPWQPLQQIQPTGFIPVTAGAFTSTHRSYLTLSADSIAASITIGVDAATTGELRLETAGPTDTAVIALPAGSIATYSFAWQLGPDGVGLALGTGISVDVQVRRTAGAGNINVHQPAAARISDVVMLLATENGIPYLPAA